jgi:hypothetical protein
LIRRFALTLALSRRERGPVLKQHLSVSANLTAGYQPRKMCEGAVVGAFGVGREEAARQLVRLKMISDAFATESLSRARMIGAGTLFEVLGLVAFHGIPFLKQDH